MTYVRKEELAEGVTLYQGDCRDILPTIGKVDAVVTDPPYGIGFEYLSYIDTKENLKPIVSEIVPSLIIFSDRVIITPGISNVQIYPLADWIGAWTWDTTATYGALGYSQWQPILFYGKDVAGFGSVNGVLKSDRINFSGGSAKINNNKSDKNKHPCPKPLEFIVRLIARFSWGGETILDPFMGSGTTGVAAVRLGRKFIGIELDPAYFDIACRRISEALKQPDLLIEIPAPKPKQEVLI